MLEERSDRTNRCFGLRLAPSRNAATGSALCFLAARSKRDLVTLSHTLLHLVHQWSYLGILLGTFVEGEAVLLSAGALAQLGLLALPAVVLSAAVGSLAWGETWFWVGQHFGRGFIDRRPKLRARALVVERWTARHRGSLTVGFRFIAGAAIVVPLLIGASGYPRKQFLALDAVGALLWSSVYAALGFGAGSALEKVLGHAVRLPEIVALVLAGALLSYLCARGIGSRLARRAGARSPSEPVAEERPSPRHQDVNAAQPSD